MAAGAGAGLATAFNSPIAGAVFVLEELVQRFEHRIAHRRARRFGDRDRRRRGRFWAISPDFSVDAARSTCRRSASRCSWCWALSRACSASATIACCWRRIAAVAALRPLPPEMAGGAGRRGGRRGGVVRAGAGRRRRRHHPAHAVGRRGRSPSCRSLFLMRVAAGARPPTRPARRAGCSRRMLVLGAQLGPAVRRRLAALFPGLGHSAAGLRRGRHGGLLHRRGARAADRHRADHRDDRGVQPCCCRCWSPASPPCWCRPCWATCRSTRRCAKEPCGASGRSSRK